ncbi:PilZ domain-containing protein [Methylomonas sp. MgM2]
MLNATSETERRRFFRIEDTISLFYRPIDDETANLGLKAKNKLPNEYSLAAILDVLSQEALRIMQRLEKQNDEMLELYKVLDAKINAVAQTAMFRGSSIRDSACQDVNLSASGVAFQQSNPLDIGQNIAIEMFLPATMALIMVYGKVINCETLDPDGYLISVEFTDINDDDQELLIKHVVRKQWQQLQEKRSRLESTPPQK